MIGGLLEWALHTAGVPEAGIVAVVGAVAYYGYEFLGFATRVAGWFKALLAIIVVLGILPAANIVDGYNLDPVIHAADWLWSHAPVTGVVG